MSSFIASSEFPFSLAIVNQPPSQCLFVFNMAARRNPWTKGTRLQEMSTDVNNLKKRHFIMKTAFHYVPKTTFHYVSGEKILTFLGVFWQPCPGSPNHHLGSGECSLDREEVVSVPLCVSLYTLRSTRMHS